VSARKYMCRQHETLDCRKLHKQLSNSCHRSDKGHKGQTRGAHQPQGLGCHFMAYFWWGATFSRLNIFNMKWSKHLVCQM
jgi:hypothetical protein